jgi:hypothetical protein
MKLPTPDAASSVAAIDAHNGNYRAIDPRSMSSIEQVV